MAKGGLGVGKITSPDLVQVADGVKVIPGANTFLMQLDKVINWSRAGSIWPVTFGLA